MSYPETATKETFSLALEDFCIRAEIESGVGFDAYCAIAHFSAKNAREIAATLIEMAEDLEDRAGTPNNDDLLEGNEATFQTACATFADQLNEIDAVTPCDPFNPDHPPSWWIEMYALKRACDHFAKRDRPRAADWARKFAIALEPA